MDFPICLCWARMIWTRPSSTTPKHKKYWEERRSTFKKTCVLLQKLMTDRCCRGLVAQNAERERQREQQGSNTSNIEGNMSIFSSRVSDSKFSLQSSTPSHMTTVTLHKEVWKNLCGGWKKRVVFGGYVREAEKFIYSDTYFVQHFCANLCCCCLKLSLALVLDMASLSSAINRHKLSRCCCKQDQCCLFLDKLVPSEYILITTLD